jgi:putative transposase
MGKYIHKSHNVSMLLYHLVCPAKYRKVVFDEAIDLELKDICLEISSRYEIEFIEIGTDQDHVHFLVQSVPMYSAKKLAQTIKSITAKELFKRCPELKEKMWGGSLWTSGYFINTVGASGNEQSIAKYVQNQGNKDYKKIHVGQLKIELF